MITPGSVNPLLMAGGRDVTPCGGSVSVPSYVIKNSLRFRKSASAYINRVIGAPTLGTKFTYSGWVKRGALGVGLIFSLGNPAARGNYIQAVFYPDDKIVIYAESGTNLACNVGTNSVFRDPSAWYHVVVAIDTTQAIQADRTKIYINGVFQPITITMAIAQNVVIWANTAGYSAGIGAVYNPGPTNFLDGYVADAHFIDGQALDASAFGEFDSFNGVWQPKAYAGAYGANGFWLKFDDAAQIGKDSSGNNNHWTANNIDVAAPGTQATYDLMKDSPVMFDDGTANPPGNYATLNAVSTSATHPISDGNLHTICTAASGASSPSTIGCFSGKWYWEVDSNDHEDNAVGIVRGDKAGTAYGYYYRAYAGYKFVDGVSSAYGAHWGANTGGRRVIGVALDCDANTLTFYLDGVAQPVLTLPANNTGWFAQSARTGSYGTNDNQYNFGQRPFKYAPPAGFKALCTTNLPYCQPFDKPDGTAPHNATVTLAANEFKYLGYVPTVATGVTWGTQLDKLSNGVKAHTAGTYTITNSGERFKTGLAQGNP